MFIFPSKAGFSFLLVLLILWLTATNYENNLLFAVCYLLTSIFIIAIYHTHQNLSGLHINVLPIKPVYAGDKCEIGLQLSVFKNGLYDRPGITLSWYDGPDSKQDKTTITVSSGKPQTIHLFFPSIKRGWLQAPRITVETTYPFGWLRCWTHLAFNLEGLVYPKPVPAGALPFLKGGGEAAHVSLASTGDDDFSGHSIYQQGMPLQRVDWKIWARGGEMFVKNYASGVDERLWLDWEYLSGLDVEQRLSRLCDWILQADRRNLQYGLRLPNLEVVPGRGDYHRSRALGALALFSLAPKGQSKKEGNL
ncbi:MAG: DUF58 domain-containing protein [Cellvibrionaceae bacterium]